MPQNNPSFDWYDAWVMEGSEGLLEIHCSQCLEQKLVKTWGGWQESHLLSQSSPIPRGSTSPNTDVLEVGLDGVGTSRPVWRKQIGCLTLPYHIGQFLVSAPRFAAYLATLDWSPVLNTHRLCPVLLKTFCVIDATALRCVSPSSLSGQSQHYSSYKSHTTLNGSVGIARNGAFIFVSQLFSGPIDDHQHVIESGFLGRRWRLYQLAAASWQL